jgi:hypothetical protein
MTEKNLEVFMVSVHLTNKAELERQIAIYLNDGWTLETAFADRDGYGNFVFIRSSSTKAK